MRYSLQPRKRKYVEGYGFARKFGDKYGKKIIGTATKTDIDAAKIASKRVVQKAAEAAGDLIGNKIADKITSAGKTKNKGKENETTEIEKIYIPPEKKQQIIDDLTYRYRHRHSIKMEYQKITNILGNIPDKVPNLLLKNG